MRRRNALPPPKLPPVRKAPRRMPTRLQKHIIVNKYPEDVKIPLDEGFPFEKLRMSGDPLKYIRLHTQPPIYGVYFICCLGNYKEIVAEQMATLHRSGLLYRAQTIFCFICLYNEEILRVLDPYMSKLKIISTPENLYERFALENFRTYIPTSNHYYLFYFHTKGVSRDPKNMNAFHERRKNLDYFILERYEVCLFWLNRNYDAVGTSLSLYPAMHFSGNFWWAQSSHLNRLPPTIVSTNYLAPEMYVCSVSDARYLSVCQTTNDRPNSDYQHLTNVDILTQSTGMPIVNKACRRMTI